MSLLRVVVGSTFLASLVVLAGCHHSDSSASETTYTVTSSGTHLAVNPSGAATVRAGNSLELTVTPDTGYTASSSVGGSCPSGGWSGGVYVTGTINADCTVTFSAAPSIYTVTPTADSGVTLSPSTPQSVTYESTTSFTVAPPTGYTISVSGSCVVGALSGSAYTTGAVTGNCGVHFGTTPVTPQVSVSTDAQTTASPSTAQTVSYGGTATFALTAASGYSVSRAVGGSCLTGSWSGTSYTTGAVTANCSTSFSSWLNWAGVKQQGVASADTQGQGVAIDSLGYVYITGYSTGALNGAALIGYSDAFLVKYDPSGNLVWSKHLGASSQQTVGQKVAVDGSGNLYVAGYTSGGLNGNPAPGGQSYFVAKYQNDGTLLWVQQAGTYAAANAVAADATGNVYISGNTTSGLNGNAQTGSYDYFVGKYDPNGTLLWLKQLGVSGNQAFANAVGVDTTGNVFVGGATKGGLAGNTQSGQFDYVIAKYDANGNFLWLKQAGASSGITTATNLAMDVAGNAFVVGATTVGLDGNSEMSNQDYYVAKYDTNGTLLWLQQLGVAATYAGAMGATTDAAGDVVVSGFTNAGLAGNTVAGSQDSFVAKYNSSGTMNWLKQIGPTGSAISAANAVAVDYANNVFAAGYTGGGLDGNTQSGTKDYWLAKYSSSGLLQ